ncbi:uncharacterized protein At1g28695 isoform X2 [Ricinus communis]|uniref:Pentatricopeptide repeat-containing protein, putative n=1 Tax=Ricinus communis TaxID=3988 RepID=B9SKF0_RICCO|nr:uncharacterized protein At1g28695 isoform X2 [Ricinus communis]EEF35871.1 pentatricopeptide repeat-containing protein, putative [Ricinus communis]|eukprot:XP_002526480.1 uncharacterized protein At1g28695 isoform X2 [Ricinus communis]
MQMESSNNSLANLALFSLLFGAGVIYLFVLSASSSTNPLLAIQRISSSNPDSASYNIITFPIDELELALRRASMPNKTVIIVILNKAYAEPTVKSETTMLDLFLESFWVGEDTRPLLDHLLLVAADQTAYERCMFKRLNCYKMETEGVDFGGEKLFMSKDFIKMMWRRTLLLLDVLKHGYSFIFTDADVMWLRNPFPRLSKNESVDLQISTDWFNGDPLSEKNLINTGFYYVKSNNKTIALFENWYSRKDNSTGKKEQDVLFDLMREGTFRRLELNARFLDTVYFSGFCTDSRDVKAVATVHANCCRSISAKVLDLRSVLRDWMRYKAAKRVATNGTVAFQWSGHFGCWNSWNKTSV